MNTVYLPLPAAAASILATALVRQPLLSLSAAEDHAQAEDGTEQALAAFMDERAELKAEVAELRTALDNAGQREAELQRIIAEELKGRDAYTGSLRAELAQVRSDGQTMLAAMLHASDYLSAVRAQLAALGIDWSPNETTGEPVISIDVVALASGVGALVEAA